MYRLLIVTREQRVEEIFDSMQGWETMGFKPPRLRKTVEEAVECMHKHHIDAIAIDAEPEYAELEQWLNSNAPDMPIFEIAEDAEQQLEVVREIEQLLNQLHTDDSNDDYEESYYFKMARERWMKRLISGFAPSKEYILKHQRMYRCADDPNRACVYARIGVPEGDVFMTGRWHYGSERLGTALQNFFGEEHEHLLIHLAVISPEEIRVVICPRMGDVEHGVSLPKAKAFIEETIEQIQHYLGLTMTLTEIQTRNGLVDFAAECARE
ncbi:MAG TPA: hypothetical protein PKJ47_13005 [Candidatus Limiplasma sp.]|nr:hypothetical protein [Candidatus Limiplasma sp.]